MPQRLPVTHETAAGVRTCRRAGCMRPVKKSTGKYCSVACCASDPDRIATLRERARASSRRVLPMARQLAMPFGDADPEAELLRVADGRDDVPAGMSRLVI